MYGFARKALFAALLAGVAGPALAADYIEEPIEVVAVGGWYIRGYLGMSNQFFDGLESDLFDTSCSNHGWYDEGGFGSAPIVGGGIGYEFNDYLRGDITVEWRGKSDFYALDWLITVAAVITTNEYTAKKSELVFMANGYYDFGDFYGITPYVGAGIGASYNTISHFRDINTSPAAAAMPTTIPSGISPGRFHAGLGFQATERMTIDFGYSFISLGDAETGTLHNDDGIVSRRA